jgi:hypothetical protein
VGEPMRSSVVSIGLLLSFSFFLPTFCCAQTVPSQSAGDSDAQLCTIAGKVVSSNTGEPIKKARVFMYPKTDERQDEANKQPSTAITDAAGHFSIDKIPAGKYSLVVIRDNYMRALYGQDQPDKPGATLSLAPSQKITDLLFRLQRTAVITGRVQDEDGEPVRWVIVTAVSHSLIHGKLKDQQEGSTPTNDLGEYRITDLKPGRYIVRADPRHNFFSDGSSDGTGEYVSTFYSGTTESARASILVVKSGDEISGIDFVLAPQTRTGTYKIRGHVSNSITDNLEGLVFITISPRSSEEQSFVIHQHSALPANPKTGEFEIKGVAPGEYVVSASSVGGGHNHTTAQNVSVTNRDVEGVTLLLTDGIDIAGKVTFDGKSAASATFIRIELDPSGTARSPFGGSDHALAKPDGSFVVKGVGDGSYSITVYSGCEVCYLKSATADGVDLLDQGVQISSGAGPSAISIVYSSNTGTVNGTVTAKDDLPAPGALVILVPNANSHQKQIGRQSSTTDQYGHFEIRGVPPGNYRAFAWEKDQEDSYDDLEFLKTYENMAESIDISGNDRKTVQLKMIASNDSTN